MTAGGASLGQGAEVDSPGPPPGAAVGCMEVPMSKVHVDQGLCQGHGRCYATAPDLFEPDDIGNGFAIGDGAVPPASEGRARVAVANCPERAITLDDTDTGDDA